MSDQSPDLVSPDAAAAPAGAASRDASTPATRARGTANPDDSGLLAAADREHLEREIAAIERASAALRRAEPELESWVHPPAARQPTTQPVWLLIGALWLSTAMVTIGAVFAISVLVG
jgi:hypothetical protein